MQHQGADGVGVGVEEHVEVGLRQSLGCLSTPLASRIQVSCETKVPSWSE